MKSLTRRLSQINVSVILEEATMGFLDKMLKDVEKGVGRAQFEADKLMKVNNLKSEVEKLKRERHDLLAEIGDEAVALYASHEIPLPGLDLQLARLGDLTQHVKTKEADLAAAQATAFAAGEPAVSSPIPTAAMASAAPAAPVAIETPAPAAPMEAAPATLAPAGRPAFCANCGGKLPPTGVFCPECGTKV
jgi:hypothetical protein